MSELIPVDHDPFGGSSDAPLRLTVRPADAAGPQLIPVDHDPFAGPGYVEDVAKSIPTGLAKGVAGMVGLPELGRQGAKAGADFLFSHALKLFGVPEDRIAEIRAKVDEASKPPIALPSSRDVVSGIESVAGPLHKAATKPGKYAETISEFIPAAGRKLITMAALPGAASEAAGQATEGSPLEPYVRVGAAIATGGAGAMLTRPRTAEQALQRGMGSVDPQTINKAEALIADAQARGITLTWPEAIEQVAPGAGLVNTQRLLESARDTSGQMGQALAPRPGQVDRAARQELGAISPPTAEPSMVGPAAGKAAESTVNDVRGAINNFADPFYKRAESVLLSPQEMAQVRALPGYDEAFKAVRSDPQLNRYVSHLPGNSVGFLNEVKKYLDQQSKNAAAPLAQNPNMQRAAGYGADAKAAKTIGTNASLDYATALGVESAARERFLDPLLKGPLGKLADRDITTRRAIDALFPANPLPNSAQEISTAVSALAKRNPKAAADLVRAHVESVFNEATQNLKGGAAAGGAGKFAATLVGNPQQRANLEAAVKALPNGDQVWKGFNRFIEIAEATGKRQDIGSRTAFNAADLADLSRGKITSEGAKAAVSWQRLLTGLGQAWDRWQLGSNLGQLAHVLTNPQSGNMLRAIASRPSGSREATVLAARLGNMGTQSFINSR